MNPIIRKALPHLYSLAGFLALAILYFLPQLQGKVVSQGDVLQYRGMTQEILEVQGETGRKPLWTNAMFGGMPSYQINIPNNNYLSYLDRILRFGFDHPIGRFLVAMLCFYVMMLALGASPLIGFIGAATFGFTTNSIMLYDAGHITKLRAISYFPLIAAGLINAYRQKYLWGGVLFALGFGLNLYANHVQMTYYFFLTIPLFIVAVAVKDLQQHRLAAFGKATGSLVLAGLLAIGSSATILWTTYEYSAATMRGEPILEAEAQAPQARVASSSETEGLAWDYAMQWSNGLLDLLSSFIPGAAGGGSGEQLDPDDATYRFLQRQNVNPDNVSAPLYWGSLPFTSGPIYFGAAACMLFLMGLFLIEGPLRWWAGLGVLLTMLLSLGKNLEFFNSFFYYYVPLYNKFRTPNSVLSVASFLIPMLGILSLGKILDRKVDERVLNRSLALGGGIIGGISLLLWLVGPSLLTFRSAEDAQLEQMGWDMQAILADRRAMLGEDALRAFLIVAATVALIKVYTARRINQLWFTVGLGLLLVGDLWMVDRRYLNYDSFVSPNDNEAFFNPRPVDEQILLDTDPNYRVFDLTGSPFQSARYSYYHKMLGGYHAAKLQRYQDIIDRHLSQGNQAVVDMLNTRYIIQPGPNNQPVAQRNPGALGNAWLVDSLVLVESPNAEINALNDIDPATTAVVNAEFSDYVAGLDPNGSGSIELTAYQPDDLRYRSNNANESLAVFSEVWYDKGWQAYLDGEPVPHIRVDYILRALRLPPGQHEIRFVFEPRSYYTGKAISIASSLTILLALLGLIGYNGFQNWDKWQTPVQPAPTPKKTDAGKGTARRPGRRRKR